METGRPSAVGTAPHGRSLVATRAIAAGEVVERLEGPEMSWAEVPEDDVVYAINLVGHRWLVPRANARYANHACDPNCLYLPTGEIVARRPVAAGEELTFPYNWVDPQDLERDPDRYFWDPRWSFVCGCGSPRCQGVLDRYVVTPESADTT